MLRGGSAVDMAIASGGTAIVSSGGIVDVKAGAADSGTLTNSGAINVSSGATLTLGGTVKNVGTIETLSGGTAVVTGDITNTGKLFASGAGSLVQIAIGAVVSGGVTEVGNGIVDIEGASSESVSFLSGSGGLEISDNGVDPTAYAGKISGFGGSGHLDTTQYIDLAGVASGGTITFNYASGHPGNTSGTLTVSSGGVLVATIDLIGTYSSGNFNIGSGSNGTVEITDPAGAVVNGGSVETGTASDHQTLGYSASGAVTKGTPGTPDLALFGNYMAGFVTSAGGLGGTLVTQDTQTANQPPPLTHPHTG